MAEREIDLINKRNHNILLAVETAGIGTALAVKGDKIAEFIVPLPAESFETIGRMCESVGYPEDWFYELAESFRPTPQDVEMSKTIDGPVSVASFGAAFLFSLAAVRLHRLQKQIPISKTKKPTI